MKMNKVGKGGTRNMGTKIIDNALFIKMLRMGLNNLTKNREIINKLNVFPVPDGDTGTNMNLSLTSGVEEAEKVKNEPLSSIMTAFVRGLLMGARGNSGVILSQLFRGFATDITDETKLNTQTLAKAFQ